MIDFSGKKTATDEDRRHFCSYDQAYMAIPDGVSPFQSNGHRHIAVNLSTGHCIPCADAYMALGYVAGSAALFPQWKFVIQMGSEVVGPFEPHPRFNQRLINPRWAFDEQEEKDRLLRGADQICTCLPYEVDGDWH